MSKMMLKEMYARHQELWFWLADNPGKWKGQWPGWKKHLLPGLGSQCFPCEYITEYYNSDVSCQDGCPLDWPDGECLPVPMTTESIYREWKKADLGSNHRALMADLIANVLLKKGLKE